MWLKARLIDKVSEMSEAHGEDFAQAENIKIMFMTQPLLYDDTT